MNRNFQILQNFALANLKTQIYKPGVNDVVAKAAIYEDTGIIRPQNDKYVIRKSKLGTAIFSDLYFETITYKDFTYSHSPIDTALFQINQEKIIQKTVIQGRSGSVKEYIADGDFIINIKGIITGDNGVYPQEEVSNLIKMLKLPIALKVNSQLLSLFDIFSVVVESYNFPQTEGSQSQQLFEINCVSDNPVELKIFSAGISNPNTTI
jgi:hypothetical protein